MFNTWQIIGSISDETCFFSGRSEPFSQKSLKIYVSIKFLICHIYISIGNCMIFLGCRLSLLVSLVKKFAKPFCLLRERGVVARHFFPPQEESMDNLQAIVVEEDHQNVTRSMDNFSAGVVGLPVKEVLGGFIPGLGKWLNTMVCKSPKGLSMACKWG